MFLKSLFFPIPPVIRQFASVFRQNGFSLYVVGGAVRDYILKKENHDFDFCTDAMPEQMVGLFKHTIPTGIKHGTVTILFKGNSFEVTTFRTESDYSDGRHPDNVNFVRSLEEDLSRRDFTVNAFAADCNTGEITDLFNGMKDAKNKIIRAIGNPEERFTEDSLRLMRMARFCSKLGFSPDKATLEAASRQATSINRVSKERIFDELIKTLNTSKPSVGIRLLEDTGILKEILPELAICRTIEQNKSVSNDLLEHILNSLDAAAGLGYGQTVRLSLLLHDIAKPVCMNINGNGAITFNGHDIKGAKMATQILKNLKCSNETIYKCSTLISNHMIAYNPNWSDGAVKRFINRVGKENINELFELQWCDQIASVGNSKVEEYQQFIEHIKQCEQEPLTVKDLAISGNDLNSIGIPKDKSMGIILNQLLELVLDNPSLNNHESLIEKSLIIFHNIERNGQ